MINKIKKKHKVIIIIPARYKSKRLDKKLLKNISGIPMVVRVAQTAQSFGYKNVLVATDSREIFNLCEKNNINVLMSKEIHKSGTDRVYEAYVQQKKKFDIIINLQGDLPIFGKKLLDCLVNLFEDKKVDLGTAVCNLEPEEIKDKNIVKAKVIFDGKIGNAVDFKRSISSIKDYFHHIGVYAFRPEKLKEFVNHSPSKSEISRNLEQLRALDNNMKIKSFKIPYNPPSVDTIEDLKKIRLLFKKNNFKSPKG